MDRLQNTIKEKNSLSTFRLLAAFQVVWGHYVNHLHLSTPYKLNFTIDFFSGVPLFLMLSGFLIWKSVESSPDYRNYLTKRFWRIYPELWGSLVFEIISIILLYDKYVSPLDLGGVFFAQGTIFQFWTPNSLRAWGCGAPNGALWTICVLIQFYIFVWFLHKWMHERKLYVWLLIIIFLIVYKLIFPQIQQQLPEIAGKLFSMLLPLYLWMFMIGSLISEYDKKILPILKKYWYVYLLVAIIIHHFHLYSDPTTYDVAYNVFLFCGVVGFAYSVPQVNIKTDISYGIYIYHVLIMNIIISLGLVANIPVAMAGILITCSLAWLSTKYIGGWAAKQKNKLSVN